MAKQPSKDSTGLEGQFCIKNLCKPLATVWTAKIVGKTVALCTKLSGVSRSSPVHAVENCCRGEAASLRMHWKVCCQKSWNHGVGKGAWLFRVSDDRKLAKLVELRRCNSTVTSPCPNFCKGTRNSASCVQSSLNFVTNTNRPIGTCSAAIALRS